MATPVKIKGLERDNPGATGTVGPTRGFRVASGYGLQYPAGVKATATVASTPTFTFTAKYGGTWANGHAVTVALAGTAGAIAVAYAAGTGVPTYTISTGGTLTVTQAVAALNADSRFSQLYTAAGTGAALTVGGTGTLATGTNVVSSQSAGQVIYVTLSSKGLMIVDVDDAVTQRTLRRGTNRYISLGAA